MVEHCSVKCSCAASTVQSFMEREGKSQNAHASWFVTDFFSDHWYLIVLIRYPGPKEAFSLPHSSGTKAEEVMSRVAWR